MRVNTNKTKVMISGERQKVMQTWTGQLRSLLHITERQLSGAEIRC